jgi:hypothetical protein
MPRHCCLYYFCFLLFRRPVLQDSVSSIASDLHRTGAISGQNKAAVHWGTPSPQFQEWETIQVYCHGFADLSTARGVRADSPEFTCLGNRWSLRIYPGGSIGARDDYVTIYLTNRSDKSINILYGLGVNYRKNGFGVKTKVVEVEISPRAQRSWSIWSMGHLS